MLPFLHIKSWTPISPDIGTIVARCEAMTEDVAAAISWGAVIGRFVSRDMWYMVLIGWFGVT